MPEIIVNQICNCSSCEKFARGIGSGGDETRGRCTNAFSTEHEIIKGEGDSCPHWIPMEYTPSRAH
jgi:hypothetical protein